MVPEVVGTMGMSSASMGMDQGMWNWGANSLITMFLVRQRKAITDRNSGVPARTSYSITPRGITFLLVSVTGEKLHFLCVSFYL